MAKACVLKNARTETLLRKLVHENRIEWYWATNLHLCFEFSDKLRINLSDYAEDIGAAEEFRTEVVMSIINTLDGAVVKGIDTTWIELEPTERTELICFRVSKPEKKEIEKRAREAGMSVSEYIRKIVLGEQTHPI